jgi:hypothetical protein
LCASLFDFTGVPFLVTVVEWYEILCFEVDAIFNHAPLLNGEDVAHVLAHDEQVTITFFFNKKIYFFNLKTLK